MGSRGCHARIRRTSRCAIGTAMASCASSRLRACLDVRPYSVQRGSFAGIPGEFGLAAAVDTAGMDGFRS